MKTRHLVTHGDSFHFVCRVPRDIIALFPSTTIWKSLRTKDPKSARLLADKWEYHTQKLFVQLRSEMLPRELEKKLVAEYLLRGAEALEARALGRPIREGNHDASGANAISDALDSGFEALGKAENLTATEARQERAHFTEEAARGIQELLADKDTFSLPDLAKALAEHVKGTLDRKITMRDVENLVLPLVHAKKQLVQAEGAMLLGDWSPMESLKANAARDLATPFFDFKTAITKYREYYLASKTNLRPGTIADMEVECRVLLDIMGNASLADINTMESLTRLKRILLKYPLNKQQRFGDRSIHTILRSERNYAVIGPKTANNYIARMMAIIDFAAKSKMINSVNVFRNERFESPRTVEDERPPYSAEDIVRLIVAICTKPLWTNRPPRPERFWIILIALFHGLRLGNIVALTKQDICRTDRGTWIFRLTTGKTKSTIRPVAICDSLLLLGLLEWVESLPRTRLFQDSSRTFSMWYNRNEIRGGKPQLGFEAKYVTKDEEKCLYSLRHSFARGIFDVTGDYKITSDIMGHSTGKSVTARYTKLTKAETQKEVIEKMRLPAIDLDLLEARAKELFDLPS